MRRKYKYYFLYMQLDISDFHFFVNIHDILLHFLVGFTEVADGATGVQHSRMILVSAISTNHRKRQMSVLLGEIHADLADLHNLALARLRVDSLDRNTEIVTNNLLDIFNGDLLSRGFHILINHFTGKVEGDVAMVEGSLRQDGDHRAFQLTGVRRNAQRQIVDNFLRKLDTIVLQLLGNDGRTSFQIRNLQVGGQSPFEAVQQSRLKTRDVHRRLVGSHDNLLLQLVQMVEYLEESFLCLRLVAGNKLDIVNDEHIHRLIKPVEIIEVVALDSLHVLLVEGVSADINDDLVGEIDLGLNTDSVDQVRLAQSNIGVDKQRVEGVWPGALAMDMPAAQARRLQSPTT